MSSTGSPATGRQLRYGLVADPGEWYHIWTVQQRPDGSWQFVHARDRIGRRLLRGDYRVLVLATPLSNRLWFRGACQG